MDLWVLTSGWLWVWYGWATIILLWSIHSYITCIIITTTYYGHWIHRFHLHFPLLLSEKQQHHCLKKIDHGWKKVRECLTWSTCKQHASKWAGMIFSLILVIGCTHIPRKGFGSRPQLGQREVPSMMFPVYSLLHWLQWRHLQPIPTAPAICPKDCKKSPAIDTCTRLHYPQL